MVRASVPQGRSVLQRIIRGRILFTPRPDGRGYDFSAPTRFDKLFAGVACPVPAWMPEADPSEPLGPEETLEGDYGRLLEAAMSRKGWCARRDLNPRPTGSKPGALSN